MCLPSRQRANDSSPWNPPMPLPKASCWRTPQCSPFWSKTEPSACWSTYKSKVTSQSQRPQRFYTPAPAPMTRHFEMKNHLQHNVGDLFTDDWSHCVLWTNPLLASCLVTWGKYHGCCVLGTFPSARRSLGSRGKWVNSVSILWI